MKVCFVLRNAFDVFTESSNNAGAGGGAEIQMYQVGMYLKKKGHKIICIAETPSNANYTVNGVEIYGLPSHWKRLDYIRLSKGLLDGIKKTDADIYISRILNVLLPVLQYGVKQNKKAYIFSVAGSKDVDGKYINSLSQPYRSICEWGLRNCENVVTQSLWQKKELNDRYKIKSHEIGNGIDLQFWKSIEGKHYRPVVLWLGNIRPIKRIDRLIKIASLCPGVKFIVAGRLAVNQSKLLTHVPNNIKVIGAVSRKRVRELMHESSILLNTSDSEGFPNTFLEARAMGIYVICINLKELQDNLFSSKIDLGFVAPDCVSAATRIKEFIASDQELKNQYSQASKKWVEEYSIENIGKKWEYLIDKIVKTKDEI